MPNPPPKKLVSIKIFKVSNTSCLPAMPNEKFPLTRYWTPSRRKLEIGMITKSATINEVKEKSFNSVTAFLNPLISIFKNQLNPNMHNLICTKST